jgi:hypothetical protein
LTVILNEVKDLRLLLLLFLLPNFPSEVKSELTVRASLTRRNSGTPHQQPPTAARKHGSPYQSGIGG